MRARTASLLLAAVLPAAVLTGCGSSQPKAAAAPPKPATCPLTGQPAPGGKAPHRIALAIKIGNEPAARPQSGLDDADIVFEEPIEGAITRLLAVYQCRDSAKVGPVRSTRWIDDQLLPMFGHPAFAFAGGINPDEDLVRATHLVDLNFTIASDAFHRSTDRTAPDNLFTNTAALWGKAGSGGPPSPVFSYSSAAATGRAVSSVTVAYSSYYSSGWRWESGTWVWYVNGAANPDASGSPVTVTNVVILDVRTVPGPYVEDSTGNHGVRSITVGSGRGLLLRGGTLVPITWSRSAADAPFVLRAGNATATLSPGRTWVMLVPVDDKVNVG
jgi:hypothetical protein